MKGTTIRNIILLLKLFITFILFAFINGKFHKVPLENLLYIILMFMAATFTFLYCFYSNYIEFRTHKRNPKLDKKIKKLNMKEYSEFPIYYSNTKYKNYLVDLLKNINESQKKTFKDKGYVIIIGSPKELNKITKIKRITGIFSHFEKYILLYIDEKTNEESFETTFYHEWGHFVDYYSHYISHTIKFRKLYSDKKQRLYYSIKFLYINNLQFYLKHNPNVNMYELKNNSEYFAVNYSKYKRNILDDKNLFEIFEKIEGCG